MPPLALGLLAGWLSSIIIFLFAARYAYARFLRLQKRTHQAERLAELGTLTGGLAHEIKNPLSTVGLNLQLLREDLNPNDPSYPRLTNRLATVQRETARLKDILDDFLRYAGKLELDKKPTNLNDLLEELVDFFHPQAQLSRVQLRLRKSPDNLIVPVDPRLIKQAVLNLMLNGVQAMNDKGGDLLLSTSLQNGEALIDIIDTGPGIPPDATQKIFQAYYSTKKGGTGLGLPMTRRIIEEHGGHLTVSSEPQKGTDFTIHLPTH
ncbi:MAG TPA: ATP-binding protein [Tepidisphaeraceae bacterium]|jgi:signal transduction histidine kinase|nr:ATP-binding protein [Tepidisphaeraceae bacterium]